MLRRERSEVQPMNELQTQLSRPSFLTVAEVAELLRVKPRTIYEMVAQKKIPFRKAGRRTLFLLEEVLPWTNRTSLS